MCGIAAILAYADDAPGPDLAELRTLRDSMAVRGPDDAGEWRDPRGRLALGHRRLAIIDLSPGGHQPMISADGTLAVSFNGEIYNHRELRARLERRGYHFQSASDTEVLLHLYAEKGPEMVRDLRGMFAFALWDARRQGLLLARDPFGIKPLYYADDGKTLRAASQVKALLAGGHVDTRPEAAGHVAYFLWGFLPDPHTAYRGIRALPAGTTLWVDRCGHPQLNTFCDPTKILAEAEAAPVSPDGSDSQACLRTALADSVRHHLMADVPVGVFLSCGLDSSTLAALASEQGTDLRTVTLGFEEYRGTPQDETPQAEEVARRYGAAHQTIWISRDDFREHYDRILLAMDQPTVDGVNSYFVSQAAVRAGLKVALSGLGGDELFGGYNSVAGETFFDLRGELAGRLQDQGARHPRSGAAFLQT
jgi:asparagine synthase (glutamine-hydrolysing)